MVSSIGHIIASRDLGYARGASALRSKVSPELPQRGVEGADGHDGRDAVKYVRHELVEADGVAALGPRH